MGDRPLLPCANCGAETYGAEEEMVEYELEFEFGGETATREVPGMVCPECGHVTPL